jgi:hypothetical protein
MGTFVTYLSLARLLADQGEPPQRAAPAALGQELEEHVYLGDLVRSGGRGLCGGRPAFQYREPSSLAIVARGPGARETAAHGLVLFFF